MAKTYEPIATTTLGSNQTSVDFSSISSSYTDLILILEGTGTADLDLCLRFNSDTGSNYSMTNLRGDGSSVYSTRDTSRDRMAVGIITGTRTMARINIQNYSNTTTYKTALARTDSTNSTYGLMARVGLWRSTSAISTVTVLTNSTSGLGSGMVLSLYGVKAA
jgi:hypothetical protein